MGRLTCHGPISSVFVAAMWGLMVGCTPEPEPPTCESIEGKACSEDDHAKFQCDDCEQAWFCQETSAEGAPPLEWTASDWPCDCIDEDGTESDDTGYCRNLGQEEW